MRTHEHSDRIDAKKKHDQSVEAQRGQKHQTHLLARKVGADEVHDGLENIGEIHL